MEIQVCDLNNPLAFLKPLGLDQYQPCGCPVQWLIPQVLHKHQQALFLEETQCNLVPKDLSKIKDMEFYLKIQADVYLHHPGQFTHADTKNKIPALFAKAFYMNLAHEVQYMLPWCNRDAKCAPIFLRC